MTLSNRKSPKSTTGEDERLKVLIIKGLDVNGNATELGRTAGAVYARANNLGLTLRSIAVDPGDNRERPSDRYPGVGH
jgi:hypothetical protein